MIKIIEIDGSQGEGGGQIIRTAAALSILMGGKFRLFNIRKGRQNPGLRTQHLKSIMAAAEISCAKLENAKISSTDIIFEPGEIEDFDSFKLYIETAGSIGLVLQMLTPVFLRKGKRFRLDIEGGAVFGKYAPPLEYIQKVILPVIRKMGYDISIDIIRYGFYPSGQAKVVVIFNPPEKGLDNIEMTNIPSVSKIKGISVATRELKNAKVAERVRTGADKFLEERGFETEIKTRYCDAKNTGCGLVLSTDSYPVSAIGSDGLGSPGLKAEFLGKYTARTVAEYIDSGCPVDIHAADQLLIYMALAKGKSSIKVPIITGHTETNIEIIKKFLDTEFSIKEDDNGFIISCEGIGFEASD